MRGGFEGRIVISGFIRNCPECFRELRYSTKNDRNKAEKKEKVCRSCAVKRVYRNPPLPKNHPDGHPRVCAECGTRFKSSRFKPNAMFCSFLCRQKGGARLGAEKRGDTLRGRGEGKTYIKLSGRHMHRVVAEEMIGRPLEEGEVVHHKDHNKRNNDPSNLEVMNKEEHSRLHSTKDRKCSVGGCDNKHRCQGYCNKHYHQYRRLGRILDAR